MYSLTMADQIRDAAEAVKGIVQAVPIYQDLLQPAAKEVGEGLRQAISLALKPLKGLVWGFDQIEAYIFSGLATKLADVPAEDILSPNPLIAGPSVESLRFSGSSPELADLFASLLASSMHPDRAALAHPAFVEIVKQLLPDEARLLRRAAGLSLIRSVRFTSSHSGVTDGEPYFQWIVHQEYYSRVAEDAGCGAPELVSLYLANLVRLGLLEARSVSGGSNSLADEFNVPLLRDVVEAQLQKGWDVTFEYFHLQWTGTGHRFIRACLLP